MDGDRLEVVVRRPRDLDHGDSDWIVRLGTKMEIETAVHTSGSASGRILNIPPSD